MPPFEEILSSVRAQDALEGLRRDESLVTVILPDSVALDDLASELNAYSDANIHVTEHDDAYLRELLVAVRN
jgi:hypothetical protein